MEFTIYMDTHIHSPLHEYQANIYSDILGYPDKMPYHHHWSHGYSVICAYGFVTLKMFLKRKLDNANIVFSNLILFCQDKHF